MMVLCHYLHGKYIKFVEVVLKIRVFTRKIMMNNVPLLGLLLLSLGGFAMLLLSPYEPILVKNHLTRIKSIYKFSNKE